MASPFSRNRGELKRAPSGTRQTNLKLGEVPDVAMLSSDSGVSESASSTSDDNISPTPQSKRKAEAARNNRVVIENIPVSPDLEVGPSDDLRFSFGSSDSSSSGCELVDSPRKFPKRKAEVEAHDALATARAQKRARAERKILERPRHVFGPPTSKSVTLHRELGETVNVFVGRPELGPVKFVIHTSYIQKRWPSFLEAIEKSTAGHGEMTVALENTAPITFYIIAKWIYEGTELNLSPPNDIATLVRALDVYSLGGKYDSTELQNQAVNTVCGCFRIGNIYPTESIISWIYEDTPDGSPMRKLLVDCYVWDIRANKLDMDKLPLGFLEESSAALKGKNMAEQRPPPFTKKSSYSVYHRA